MSTPLISLVTPVWHPHPGEFQACLDSVLAQSFDNWELCLGIDGPQPETIQNLLSDLDPRIHIAQRQDQGGIVAASNAALGLARGEFIGLLDNDDALTPDALEVVAAQISTWDDLDFLYSDEDKLDETGRRGHTFLKPSWSPERLRCQMYTGHFTVYRRTLVEDVGAFREGFDGSQDHDLALRVAEHARTVVHVPRILYHWRMAATSAATSTEAKPWAYEAGQRAVQSHLRRTHFPATASRFPGRPGVLALTPDLPHEPLVSVVIPTGRGERMVRGHPTILVHQAVLSLVERSTYQNYEIVVVQDQNSPDGLRGELQQIAGDRVRVIRDSEPFNFARACNLGAAASVGDNLIFLNDDTEIVTEDWIQRLVMYLFDSGIGAVGARLHYANGSIQHAGVFARHSHAQHRYMHFDGSQRGYFDALSVAQNCIAVTGACLAIRREAFAQVGGFCMNLPLNFNDVDLCLKLHHLGLRNVVDPLAVLIHHESSTRVPTVLDAEREFLLRRWRSLLESDPYDNPNFVSPAAEELPPPPDELVWLKQQHPGWPPSRVSAGGLLSTAGIPTKGDAAR